MNKEEKIIELREQIKHIIEYSVSHTNGFERYGSKLVEFEGMKLLELCNPYDLLMTINDMDEVNKEMIFTERIKFIEGCIPLLEQQLLNIDQFRMQQPIEKFSARNVICPHCNDNLGIRSPMIMSDPGIIRTISSEAQEKIKKMIADDAIAISDALNHDKVNNKLVLLSDIIKEDMHKDLYNILTKAGITSLNQVEQLYSKGHLCKAIGGLDFNYLDTIRSILDKYLGTNYVKRGVLQGVPGRCKYLKDDNDICDKKCYNCTR